MEGPSQRKRKKRKRELSLVKLFFSAAEENSFIILFCLLPSSTLLRAGVANWTAFFINLLVLIFIKWLILNCDWQDNLFGG